MEEKKKIICDKCKAEFEMKKFLKDRVIAKDKMGNAVMERFFECPDCGTHYSVTVIDRGDAAEILEARPADEEGQQSSAVRRKQGADAAAAGCG